MALTTLLLNEDSLSTVGCSRLARVIDSLRVRHFFEDYETKHPERQSLLDIIDEGVEQSV